VQVTRITVQGMKFLSEKNALAYYKFMMKTDLLLLILIVTLFTDRGGGGLNDDLGRVFQNKLGRFATKKGLLFIRERPFLKLKYRLDQSNINHFLGQFNNTFCGSN
jgi:hypothetical protein